MSLKDKQSTQIMDKIIMSELKKGVNPDSNIIMNMLQDWYSERPPGFPTLKVREAESAQPSSAEDYNNMLDEIDDDLTLLYDVLVDQNEQLLNNFSIYENERFKLLKQIREVDSDVDEVLRKLKATNPYQFTLTEHFANFNNINVNSTTADVDLKNNEVTLKKIQDGMEKLDLTSDDVSVGRNYVSNRENLKIQTNEEESLSKALDDDYNTFWRMEADIKESKADVNKVKTEIEIDFGKLIKFTRMELAAYNSPYQTFISASYQNENDNWVDFNIKSNVLMEDKAWNFKPIDAKKLRLRLEKRNPNAKQGTKFILGLNNISLYRMNYITEGKLETDYYKLIEDDNAADTLETVSLETEEDLPEGTSIDYQLKFKTTTNEVANTVNIAPSNREVDDENSNNPTKINLDNISQKTNTITTESSKEHSDTVKGIDFFNYNIVNSDNFIPNNVKLFRGIGKWKREAFQNKYYAEHKTSLKDWVGLPVKPGKVVTDFTNKLTTIHPGEYDNGKIDSDKYSNNGELNLNYRFTTYIYSKEATTVRTNPVLYPKRASANDGRNAALYLNNTKLNKSRETNKLTLKDNDNQDNPKDVSMFYYSLPLNEGWNKLVYLVYQRLDSDKVLLNHNSNITIKEYSNNVNDEELEWKQSNMPPIINFFDSSKSQFINPDERRAQKRSMVQVSEYRLKNSITQSQTNYFAVKEDGNLILNNNYPNKYKVEYNTVKTNVNQAKLIANLSTNNDSLTPKLEKFRFNFSY